MDRAGAEPLRPYDPARIGPYKPLGRLGQGGMGTVYLAEAPTGKLVAVKVVKAEFTVDEGFALRFHAEVSNARRVASFCTAQVLDNGNADDGLPYMVTEYIAGTPLSRQISKYGALEPGTLHGVALGVAAALAAIHVAGLVHRDLKPANVILSMSGPRVIDFGIARALDATQGVTKSGELLGSPGWWAPEQVRGEDITPAADIFAWGCLVAYAGNGRHPYGRGDVMTLAGRVLTGRPDLGTLPTPLDRLVRLATESDPRNRPSAQDLLIALVGGDVARLAPEPEETPASAPPVDPPTLVATELLNESWEPPANLADPDSGPGLGTGARTDSGPGPGPGPGTGPGTGSRTGPGTGPGTDSGTGPGTGSRTDSGTGPGSRTGPGPGTDSGTGPGTGSQTDSGPGADAGTGSPVSGTPAPDTSPPAGPQVPASGTSTDTDPGADNDDTLPGMLPKALPLPMSGALAGVRRPEAPETGDHAGSETGAPDSPEGRAPAASAGQNTPPVTDPRAESGDGTQNAQEEGGAVANAPTQAATMVDGPLRLPAEAGLPGAVLPGAVADDTRPTTGSATAPAVAPAEENGLRGRSRKWLVPSLAVLAGLVVTAVVLLMVIPGRPSVRAKDVAAVSASATARENDVGRRFASGSYFEGLDFVIPRAAQCGLPSFDGAEPPRGRYCVIGWTAMNRGGDPVPFVTSPPTLVDDRGAEHEASTSSTEVPATLAPGGKADGVLVYDLPYARRPVTLKVRLSDTETIEVRL